MFDPERFISETVERLRSEIRGKALIACSGGVDSTVSAILTHRAIGERLHALHIDTGLLRRGESEQVKKLFDQIGIKLECIDASERFLDSLKGVTDPEEKRRVIGELFVRIFEDFAEERGIEYLV
ncbi:MAG TPA: glutamine-hydrolyzing GMP synthase subunit GuaA, partial [Thermoplasmatales archaeon]|nr:glutamine-hydrolyzing GMP synthase subunit GuaA [Thermoplasmatales archaeon]HEX17456.1 glutamine-hydrolyzing GMP synthase subunit GuaA [Thermoplasmatales archaeon]